MTDDEQLALERRWYDFLKATRPDFDEAKIRAQAMVEAAAGVEPGLDWKNAAENAPGAPGLKEKIGGYLVYRWLREDGVDFIGGLISNIFAQKGWQTSIMGAGLLSVAAFVTFYCSTDATGGWIDPHCAEYVKVGLWAGGIGHVLAPGFTAAISKK